MTVLQGEVVYGLSYGACLFAPRFMYGKQWAKPWLHLENAAMSLFLMDMAG